MPTTIDSFKGEFAFLSNFYPSPIVFEGRTYPTSEHAFQAAKSIDDGERARIALLDTPGKAKRAGRKVQLRPDWEQIKRATMHRIVTIKFADPELQHKLLATGDAILIEGNTWNDTYWGVCRGKGQNVLGQILMSVRETYKRQEIQ